MMGTTRSRCLAALALLLLGSPAAYGEKAPFALQLTDSTFNSTMASASSSAYVLVEFFASWCPHCQRFKPQYERVAALFNTEPRTSPDIVVGAVDCVDQASLCERFLVRDYPTMLFGPPKGFAGDPKLLHLLPPIDSAEELLKWINLRLGTEFMLQTDTTYGHTYNTLGEGLNASMHDAAALPSHASVADMEKATVLSFEYMENSKNRRPFVAWVTLLSYNHPSPRCRAGASHLLESLDQVWPLGDATHPTAQLERWRPCGRSIVLRDWDACRGSAPTTRGYSCGLWLLFHSLATGSSSPPGMAPGKLWMTGVRSFVATFFTCTACRTHFMEMASTHMANKVSSQRDAVLWMWDTHNQVNQRLEREEAATNTGDPAFPKEQWPSADACPPCRSHSLVHTDHASEDKPDWDEDVVYQYQLYFYGNGTRPHGVPEVVPARVAAEMKDGAMREEGTLGSGGSDGPMGGLASVLLSGAALVLCVYMWMRSLRSMAARRKSAAARDAL